LVVAAVVAIGILGVTVGQATAKAPPVREVWVFGNGEYVHIAGFEWVLKLNDGQSVRCVQIGVNPVQGFIELRDLKAGVTLRLYDTQSTLFNAQTGQWQVWTGGYWK
jgi:hypothetical protein